MQVPLSGKAAGHLFLFCANVCSNVVYSNVICSNLVCPDLMR